VIVTRLGQALSHGGATMKNRHDLPLTQYTLSDS
jgi:hypothetical protein